MDELRMFLENEGWELCPVKSSFHVLNLVVSYLFNFVHFAAKTSDESVCLGEQIPVIDSQLFSESVIVFIEWAMGLHISNDFFFFFFFFFYVNQVRKIANLFVRTFIQDLQLLI